ncbi:hypothetical protein [Desulfosediminicola flagellatus]|uniref:hypothetical protein n=1 Tax=Desulfosediminicola flagellatus TaxID=2569541 RepID=UPI0010ABA793|nr:hypothetical protein [Desulfosediminicola flagellatus]
MELHKFEIQTSESDFDKLRLLEDSGVAIIGGISQQRFSSSPGDGSTGLAQDDSDQPVKVELFTSTPPEILLKKLSIFTNSRTVSISKCSSLTLETRPDSIHKNNELPVRAVEQQPQAIVEDGLSSSIDFTHPDVMHLKVEAQATPILLNRVFAAVCQFDIILTSGRKLRQGQRDFAMLSFKGVNQALQKQIKDRFNLAIKPFYIPNDSEIFSQFVLTNDLQISLQQKGPMTAMRVLCDRPTPSFRYQLLSHLASFKIDIPLARMSTRNNTIEDVYHLKPISSQLLPPELAEALRQKLTRI